MGKKRRLIYLLLLISCGDVKSIEEDEIIFDIYMNSELRNNLYFVKYESSKSHSYTSVYYQTEGLQRVEWFSDNEFCVEFMNDTICSPIINYSTYSRKDGSGQQMIRLQESFIGDTLSIKGCLLNDICKSLSFVLTN